MSNAVLQWLADEIESISDDIRYVADENGQAVYALGFHSCVWPLAAEFLSSEDPDIYYMSYDEDSESGMRTPGLYRRGGRKT